MPVNPSSCFLKSIELDGFLSFAPKTPPIELQSLNVLIGPNGSGKSNFIEAFELLHATPNHFADAIRDGGGPAEWIWKGMPETNSARIEVTITPPSGNTIPICYGMQFKSVLHRLEITDEYLQNAVETQENAGDVFFYRFNQGHPIINALELQGTDKKNSGAEKIRFPRHLKREDISPQESILSQRKEPDLYPEVAWVGKQFESIQMFRDWTIGRHTPVRKPQQADLPVDYLLPDSSNLVLLINELEHSGMKSEFDKAFKLFLPTFEKIYTRIFAGSVQLYVQEIGLNSPIPATRLSDGTIRFISFLAVLFQRKLPSLLCIEEPEIGIHPDGTTLIADLLVQVSHRTQLIVTTHSDSLVSALTEHADSVLICDRLNGQSNLKRVDSQKLIWWLEKYRLGEIWRIGELGGNP